MHESENKKCPASAGCKPSSVSHRHRGEDRWDEGHLS